MDQFSIERAKYDRIEAGLLILIFGVWVAPMVGFWVEAWNSKRPITTLSYLFATTLSIAAAWWPASWFRPRAFELSGRFYEALGVRRLRAFMVDGDIMNSWIRRSLPGYRCVSGRGSMQAFVARTCVSERAHLVMLLAMIPATVYAVVRGSLLMAAYFATSNAAVNLYPILLQRYTRARITRILARRDSATGCRSCQIAGPRQT